VPKGTIFGTIGAKQPVFAPIGTFYRTMGAVLGLIIVQNKEKE
jgi:hypothetical protein